MSDPKQDELAKCYARVFLGDEDGQRVLADLLTKFPPDGMRFDLASPDALKAALRDGQRSVTTELQTAVRRGAKLAGIKSP